LNQTTQLQIATAIPTLAVIFRHLQPNSHECHHWLTLIPNWNFYTQPEHNQKFNPIYVTLTPFTWIKEYITHTLSNLTKFHRKNSVKWIIFFHAPCLHLILALQITSICNQRDKKQNLNFK